MIRRKNGFIFITHSTIHCSKLFSTSSLTPITQGPCRDHRQRVTFSKGKSDVFWLKTLYRLLITLRINSNSLSCLISHCSPFHSSFSSYFCSGPLYFQVPLHVTLSRFLHEWSLMISQASSQMSLLQREFPWVLMILTKHQSVSHYPILFFSQYLSFEILTLFTICFCSLRMTFSHCSLTRCKQKNA